PADLDSDGWKERGSEAIRRPPSQPRQIPEPHKTLPWTGQQGPVANPSTRGRRGEREPPCWPFQLQAGNPPDSPSNGRLAEGAGRVDSKSLWECRQGGERPSMHHGEGREW